MIHRLTDCSQLGRVHSNMQVIIKQWKPVARFRMKFQNFLGFEVFSRAVILLDCIQALNHRGSMFSQWRHLLSRFSTCEPEPEDWNRCLKLIIMFKTTRKTVKHAKKLLYVRRFRNVASRYRYQAYPKTVVWKRQLKSLKTCKPELWNHFHGAWEWPMFSWLPFPPWFVPDRWFEVNFQQGHLVKIRKLDLDEVRSPADF